MTTVPTPEHATIAELLLARAEDDGTALLFEDSRWSWRELVQESAGRATLLRQLRPEGRPWHVGVLLENTPEYLFLVTGAALAGATVVGINPTRRGAELAADIRGTDCALIVTDDAYGGLLDGIDHGPRGSSMPTAPITPGCSPPTRVPCRSRPPRRSTRALRCCCCSPPARPGRRRP